MNAALRRLYRLLLYACPSGIRREYGDEMEQVFVQCLETEWNRHGRVGRAAACCRGVADVLVFAFRARWHRWGTASQHEHHNRSGRPLVIMRDIRGTIRVLRGQPVLSVAIVLMLALGIGATTAIFGVVYGVLLRPLPFPNSDRLVQVWGTRLDRGWTTVSLTEANFWDLRDRNHSFEEFGALHSASFSLTGFELPERVTANQVSTGVFRSLGVRCVAGRLFEPGEDEPGRGDNIVLLSHGFWTRRFGTDRSIVGRSLTLDGRSYTVIGVLPPGSPWLDAADVFVPFIRRPNANRGSFEYAAIGRLKAGVTFEAALADLSAVAKELEVKYPDTNAGLGIAMQPSRVWVASDDLRRTLWILLGAVGLLLVIACVNVTNLLLARASARARESAVRAALGASRADLVRERLTESLFYSVAGTALGLAIARWMLELLKSVNPGGIPRLADVGLNGWVFAFATGAAALVGLFTGLLPAFRTPFGNAVSALRPNQRGTTGDRGQSRIRAALVVAEVALSLILLVGAGLLVRSLLNVLSVDRGFQTENRMLATISIPRSYGEGRMSQTVTDLIAKVGSLPDIVAVAAVSGRPLARGSTGLGIGAADKPDTPGGAVPWATWRIVSKDYFRVMGLPFVAGRNFTEEEQIGKPWRVIVSKRVADLLWPGENPIGRTAILWKGQGGNRGEVIGVVGNMRERGLESDPTLAVYFPAGRSAATSLQLVMQTKRRPQEAIAALRTVVANVDPNLPVSNVRTMEEIVTASVATRRMTMWLIATFAGLALILALAGVFGVLSYSIARRTSEIGVRLALGAEPRRVLRLIVGQGMRPVVAGVILGLAGTFLISRLMTTLLFNVTSYDPATYVAVVGALMTVAAAACYVPARRVLRVDPAVALRVE